MRSEVTEEVVASMMKKNGTIEGPQSAIEQRREQKWDFSQIENSAEEEDVMDWYEDDELRRQWEEVSRVEEM